MWGGFAVFGERAGSNGASPDPHRPLPGVTGHPPQALQGTAPCQALHGPAPYQALQGTAPQRPVRGAVQPEAPRATASQASGHW